MKIFLRNKSEVIKIKVEISTTNLKQNCVLLTFETLKAVKNLKQTSQLLLHERNFQSFVLQNKLSLDSF